MSTLKAQIVGKGDNPHTLDSDQLMRWKHHLGPSVTLASTLNVKEVWPEVSKRKGGVKDTLYDGRWALASFKPTGEPLPRTLFIAALLAAEHLGTGLIVGWRRNSPERVIAQQVASLENIEVCRVAFTQTLNGMDGEPSLHVMCLNSVRSSYNPALVLTVEREMQAALKLSAADTESEVLRWKNLPKVWRRWLSRDNYLNLVNGPVAFNVRYDNGLSTETIRSPVWEAPPNLALRKRDLELSVLLLALRAVGIQDDELQRNANGLRRYVEKKRPGKSLIEVAVEDQGDYTPSGPPVPHLTAFAYMMLRGDD